MIPRLRPILLAAVAAVAVVCQGVRVAAQAPPQQLHSQRQLALEGRWWVRSSALATNTGKELSLLGASTQEWFSASVPSTVLSVLIKHGVYPDPRLGTNSLRIPDASDEFNHEHDLDRFSYLPDHRNPWRDPYWYRTEFIVPSGLEGRHFWLQFNALNYRADVWLNGQKLASREQVVGMFQRFRFDITQAAVPGRNALAVLVYPVDHPGKPETQLEVFGKERGYQTELMKDVTEVMSVGYDCMLTVPDRNMGLWQNAFLEWIGPVDIQNSFVATDLPLPDTSRATLGISAELVNTEARKVKGVLRVRVEDTPAQCMIPIELGTNETRVIAVEPKLIIENPRLWWPLHYGEQHLYHVVLQFEAEGAVSATRRVQFGVRKVTREPYEVDGWHGKRILVNGQRIFCRGGYLQPELLFDWDAERMEAEVNYLTQANLNLVYFEDIPNPPEPFLDLCDRYGLMFGNCFYSCMWAKAGTNSPTELPLLERCTSDLLKRYRNHPSLILYMAMNEGDTRKDVYEMWRQSATNLDGTRILLPSAYFPDSRKDVPEWFRPELPTGMTDVGATYGWQDPVTYFNRVREKRNWTFMMESGSASLPPISSLARFLPELGKPSETKAPFPLDETWAHHGANHYYQDYDQALRRLHGEPESVADYCWKGQITSADQHRSMFEAVNHRMWDITSGFTEWKLNACEPSVQWQMFDWYLKPMVSYYYIRRACEPLHVQYNLPDRTVSVINTLPLPQNGVQVRARLFDSHLKLRWEKVAVLDLPASAYREPLALPDLPDLGPLHFVKLELKDSRGQLVSDGFYWRPAAGTNDLKALQDLPPVTLNIATAIHRDRVNREIRARISVTNPSEDLAFFVQVAVVRGPGGLEATPVMWDDNYFCLLPHETRQVIGTVDEVALRGGRPTVEVGGWNVRSMYTCDALTSEPVDPEAGALVAVTATVSNTFLDGSRIELRVDGKPAGIKWAWARGKANDRVTFQVPIGEKGAHRLQVGERTLTLWAQ